MITAQQKFSLLNNGWMWITPLLLACFQIVASQYNFLLFHTLSELFAISIAITLGVVAWHMYPLTRNSYLLFIGLGYLGVATLDLMHTLTYKGLGIIAISTHDIASQFWITSRYLEVSILLLSPLFLTKTIKVHYLFFAISLSVACATYLIFADMFPHTFIYGEGLTSFKIVSEYIIIGMTLCAAFFIHSRRAYIDKDIYKLILTSLFLGICAELCFTLYISVYGISNIAGHLFKMLSFWLIFIAVIHTTLTKPFVAMARSVSTYDAIPYGAVIVDNHGIIRQTNPAAEKLSHKNKDKLIGEHCHSLFHNENISFKDCSICQKIKSNEAITLTKVQLNNDQVYEISLSPVGYHDNTFGLVHTIRDITAQSKAEQEIQESQEYNRMIFEYSLIGQSLCRATGEIVDANAAYANTIGYTTQELIGMRHDSLTPPGFAKINQKQMESLLLTGKYGPVEKQLINKNGQPIFVRMRGMLIQRRDVPLIWSCIENIQEEKINQQILTRFRQALDRVNEEILIVSQTTMCFIDFNKTAITTLGYKREEMLALGLHDILSSTNKASLRQIYEHLCAEEINRYDIDTNIIEKNGSQTRASVRLSAQHGDNHENFIIAIIRKVDHDN